MKKKILFTILIILLSFSAYGESRELSMYNKALNDGLPKMLDPFTRHDRSKKHENGDVDYYYTLVRLVLSQTNIAYVKNRAKQSFVNNYCQSGLAESKNKYTYNYNDKNDEFMFSFTISRRDCK